MDYLVGSQIHQMEREKIQTPGKGKKWGKTHSESGELLSIRSRVFSLLSKYPDIKPKKICEYLKINYKQHKNTVTQRRYEWLHNKISLKEGLGSKSSKFVPDSQNHVYAAADVPKCLDRRGDPDVVKRAVDAGWILSTNRNRALIWNLHRSTYGRIEWWETGNVNVHVKAPHHLGRVKRLVSLAFYDNGLIFDSRIFFAFVDSFGWAGSHDVFTPEQKEKRRLPPMEIRAYEKYGIAIKIGDRSHPYSVEVEWAHPMWAEKIEFLTKMNIKTLDYLNEFLRGLCTPKPLDPRDKSII